MIEFRQVAKAFRTADGSQVVALSELDLTIEPGEVHALIGTSGCGKTTALRLVNRLEVPDSGQVLVDGRDVSTVDPRELRRGVGYVIQEGGLFPHLTAAENVGIMARLAGQPAGVVSTRVDELLAFAGLVPDEIRDRRPREMSGGQRQRVGFARALMLDPACILLDEPFGALDPMTRSQLHREFEQMLRAVRKTVLLVSHDLSEAFRLADRVSVMRAGRIVQTGTREDLVERPSDAFVTELLAAARVEEALDA